MARTRKLRYIPAEAKQLALNRRAKYDYEILETLEVGLVLYGSEIKSLRENKVQIAESWAHVRDAELWLHNLYISPYSHSAAVYAPEPARVRKLLAHTYEIRKLDERVKRERLTLIPLALYLKNGRAKLTLALAKGRKKADRRQELARREAEREATQAIARSRRYYHY